MNNVVLHALAEFVSANYDKLKKEYNKLSPQEKSILPITIYCIKTFDVLLTEMKRQNEAPPAQDTEATQVDPAV